MEELDKFKSFVEFCKSSNVLSAKCGSMEITLAPEIKAIEIDALKEDNEDEKDINDILFHSVTR